MYNKHAMHKTGAQQSVTGMTITILLLYYIILYTVLNYTPSFPLP